VTQSRVTGDRNGGRWRLDECLRPEVDEPFHKLCRTDTIRCGRIAPRLRSRSFPADDQVESVEKEKADEYEIHRG
jgi:hypothetical protein